MTQLTNDIRETTVAVLIAQKTLAGLAVESDRIEGIPSGAMPRLIVYAQEEGEGVSPAGGPPAFNMTLTLVVQALIERATRADAIRDLDALILQTQIALLEDPVWNRLAGEVAGMRVSRNFHGDNDLILGDGRVEFTMNWRQNYETRVGPTLTGVNLHIDTGRPFDPVGNYPNPTFPAAPPPRKHGPDGRIEVDVVINLPPA